MITWQPAPRRRRRLHLILTAIAATTFVAGILAVGVANLAVILFTAFFGA